VSIVSIWREFIRENILFQNISRTTDTRMENPSRIQKYV